MLLLRGMSWKSKDRKYKMDTVSQGSGLEV